MFLHDLILKTVPVEHSLNYLLLTVGIDLGGSQTRRIAEVGRHNSRWFSTILPVQLEHVGQDLVQLGFESPSMETPQPFWAAILAVKKPLLVFKRCKILYLKGFFFFLFTLCPLLLVLSLGTDEESLPLSSVCFPSWFANSSWTCTIAPVNLGLKLSLPCWAACWHRSFCPT